MLNETSEYKKARVWSVRHFVFSLQEIKSWNLEDNLKNNEEYCTVVFPFGGFGLPVWYVGYEKNYFASSSDCSAWIILKLFFIKLLMCGRISIPGPFVSATLYQLKYEVKSSVNIFRLTDQVPKSVSCKRTVVIKILNLDTKFQKPVIGTDLDLI